METLGIIGISEYTVGQRLQRFLLSCLLNTMLLFLKT